MRDEKWRKKSTANDPGMELYRKSKNSNVWWSVGKKQTPIIPITHDKMALRIQIQTRKSRGDESEHDGRQGCCCSRGSDNNELTKHCRSRFGSRKLKVRGRVSVWRSRVEGCVDWISVSLLFNQQTSIIWRTKGEGTQNTWQNVQEKNVTHFLFYETEIQQKKNLFLIRYLLGVYSRLVVAYHSAEKVNCNG